VRATYVFVRSITLSLLVVLALTSAARPACARPDEPGQDGNAADSGARERSRAAFRRGVGQLRAQDWAGARVSFEEAWALFQHPSILLNLGIARLRTDDPVLAEQDLVRFLSEDPGAAPEELAGAREALAEARSKIGTLRIVATPASARVVVDGKAIPVRTPPQGSNEGGVAEARLSAGKHAVRVEADGFRLNATEVDLPAKSERDVRVVLVENDVAKRKPASPPLPPPTATRAIVGWSLAGASGLALAASGYMGLRAMSLASDYADRSNPSFQDRDVKDEGLTLRTGADVALATALVAGVGAAILLLTDIGTGSGGDLATTGSRRSVSRTAPPQSALLRW